MNPHLLELARETKNHDVKRRKTGLESIDVMLYVNSQDIYLLDPRGKENRKIVERPGFVGSLCFFNGRLYHVESEYKKSVIYDTLTSEKVAERPHSVWSLCEHQGVLYDCSDKAVHRTLENEAVFSMDDSAYDEFSAMASNGKYLYCAFRESGGRHSNVVNVIPPFGPRYRVHDRVNDLCYHDGRWFYGNAKGEIIDMLNKPNGVEVKRRLSRTIHGLYVHNGRMYDCGGDGIHETFSENHLLKIDDFSRDHVAKVCFVPGKYLVEAGWIW
jgi:hypothetical protein